MFGQIRALGKALVTALYGAGKRLFIGVDPQMIKEVASFAELFVATRVLTLHDPPNPPGVNMFVSQYLVICCIWHMFAFTH